MKPENLGQKKINNEQKINEGFSGNNLPEDYDPASEKPGTESETDEHGNKDDVLRSRHTELPVKPSTKGHEIPDSDDAKMKTAENRDFNSDFSGNPDSHPENREDRGNIKLDE